MKCFCYTVVYLIFWIWVAATIGMFFGDDQHPDTTLPQVFQRQGAFINHTMHRLY